MVQNGCLVTGCMRADGQWDVRNRLMRFSAEGVGDYLLRGRFIGVSFKSFFGFINPSSPRFLNYSDYSVLLSGWAASGGSRFCFLQAILPADPTSSAMAVNSISTINR